MAEAAELVECESSDSNYSGDSSLESDELDEVIEVNMAQVSLRMLSKSLTASEVVDQFNKVVTARHGIASERVLAISNDRASVNLASFNILSPFSRRAINIGCFSHTLANAGDQIKTPSLKSFLQHFNCMISRIASARPSNRSE